MWGLPSLLFVIVACVQSQGKVSDVKHSERETHFSAILEGGGEVVKRREGGEGEGRREKEMGGQGRREGRRAEEEKEKRGAKGKR